MRIDPSIAALRGGADRQRHAQARLERIKADWLAAPAMAAALQAFERYGDGAPLADCPALAALVSEPGAARAAVDALAGAMIDGLEESPLGHVPFRHQYADGLAVLQLARSGRATLSLMQYAPPEGAAVPDSVCFTDGERHEICLAGEARARHVSIAGKPSDEVRLDCRAMPIESGWRRSFAGRGETKIVDRVRGRLVLLRLSRQAAEPLPSLEYRLADGVLLHRAAGDLRESRQELMIALLGRMGRHDAAPAIARLTRAGSDSLRWQALRECLALDSARGFRALSRMARDASDPLHRPACTLRGDLLARYPRLAGIESEPCPV